MIDIIIAIILVSEEVHFTINNVTKMIVWANAISIEETNIQSTQTALCDRSLFKHAFGPA